MHKTAWAHPDSQSSGIETICNTKQQVRVCKTRDHKQLSRNYRHAAARHNHSTVTVPQTTTANDD